MADPSQGGRRRLELNRALEELHFAFRAVIARPDAILAKHGLSRVHHRLLYFIGRNPGVSITQLLEILRVTKQSLNGPLKQLMQRALVVAVAGDQDRRVKRLRLTPRGQALEDVLSGDQRDRFARVFKQVGRSKEEAWREVMRMLAAE